MRVRNQESTEPSRRAADEFDITEGRFGAVPNDPGKAAQNKAAIQAALNAIKAAGGGTLLIPIGVFYCHAGLVIDFSYLTTEGRNTGLRSHVFDNGLVGGSQLVFVRDPGGAAGNQKGFLIRKAAGAQRHTGIVFQQFGISAATRATNITAIETESLDGQLATDNLRVREMSITRIGVGVALVLCDAPEVTDTWLCECGTAIATYRSIHLIARNCCVADCDLDGVKLIESRNAVVTSMTFARNRYSVWLDQSRNCQVQACNFYEAGDNDGVPANYNPQFPAILINNGSEDNQISGNWIQANNKAIQVTAANRTSLRGNDCVTTAGTQANLVIDSGAGNRVYPDNFFSNGVLDNGTATYRPQYA